MVKETDKNATKDRTEEWKTKMQMGTTCQYLQTREEQQEMVITGKLHLTLDILAGKARQDFLRCYLFSL